MTHHLNLIIWEEAWNYLLTRKGVSYEMINIHLNLFKRVKINSINDIYRRLISTLTNRRGVTNWIGDLKRLESFFEDYSPTKMISKHYGWESFLDLILESDFRPPSAINKNDNRNIWVLFSKGVITGAHFLNTFSDHNAFNTFVERYIQNRQHIQLANHISRRVHGYGFALACDFLKELGYSGFVKPDVHIIDIFHALGLTKSKNEKDVFNAVLRFSESIDEIPYRVDKLFWLIGSGDFYLLDKNPITTDKFEFCRNTRATLREMGFNAEPITTSNKTLKTSPNQKFQQEFRTLNEILTILRRAEKISPEEYRNYSKKWWENPNLRVELIQDLTNMMDS